MAALMGEEAGDEESDDEDSEKATSKPTAAAKTKSEPELHSAAESIDTMMALLRA